MKFRHDCPECVPLAPATDAEPQDLYVCPKAGYAHAMGPSVIARYGNAPGEYTSAPWTVVHQHREETALVRAVRAVQQRVLDEASPRLQETLDPFLREHATRHLMASIGTMATDTLRRTNTDPAWARVLEVLHFRAEVDAVGGCTLTLAGGTGTFK